MTSSRENIGIHYSPMQWIPLIVDVEVNCRYMILIRLVALKCLLYCQYQYEVFIHIYPPPYMIYTKAISYNAIICYLYI